MSSINFSGRNLTAALEFFRETTPEFHVERTGYTATIKVPKAGKFRRYFFADSPVRPALFAVYRKLQEDVLRKPIPPVPEAAVRYHHFNEAQRRDILPARAWSVDLSAAYPQALLNTGLIRKETFKLLSELPKDERLKVVGMLATQKTCFHYFGGKIEEVTTITAETRPAFFHACTTIGNLLSEAQQMPGYLFYWVDGAFVETGAETFADFFRSHGYPCKVEEVSGMKWSRSKKFLFYTKDGKRKYLTVPGTKQPAPQWIEQLLNTPIR